MTTGSNYKSLKTTVMENPKQLDSTGYVNDGT